MHWCQTHVHLGKGEKRNSCHHAQRSDSQSSYGYSSLHVACRCVVCVGLLDVVCVGTSHENGDF